MSQTFINVAVPKDVHGRLKAVSEENGRLKLWSVIGVVVRGWAMLTPEQQMHAIRGGAVMGKRSRREKASA